MTNRNSDHPAKTSDTHPQPTGQPVEIHPAIITWALVIGLVVAFAVTASSFKLSFATLYDLAAMAGMRDSAWVIPVVLDGPILAAGIFRVALSQHTDQRTVLGRRFIIAVFALAGLASMAGNAYHAVLTVTDLNAGVAAALGALAPLMVMTMSEMMSIAISAPRHRRGATEPVEVESSQVDETHIRASLGGGDEHSSTDSSPRDIEQIETLTAEHGTLDQVVWDTVDVFLNHPTAMGKFSKAAEVLNVSPSTVRARYDKWANLQQKVAASKASTLERSSMSPPPSVGDIETASPLEPRLAYTGTQRAGQIDYANARQ